MTECCVVPDLVESFYAITVKRHFELPLLKALLRSRPRSPRNLPCTSRCVICTRKQPQTADPMAIEPETTRNRTRTMPPTDLPSR